MASFPARLQGSSPRSNRIARNTLAQQSALASAVLFVLSSLPAYAVIDGVSATGPNNTLIPEETSVGLDTVGYFSSSSSAPEGFRNSWTPQLIGKLNAHTEGAVFEAGAQADVLMQFNRMSQGSTSTRPYFELPELYVGTSRELAPVQLSVGRKLESWSKVDEQWGLGIWQPRFRWDYLHPETVGLTGAFLKVELPYFRFTALASPIFVPERGVPMSTEGGTFVSDSRWFVPPPNSLDLFGQNTPMRYSLAMPPLRELLLRPGASLHARLGAAEGLWLSASYAHKPMNQILLAHEGYLQHANVPKNIYGMADIYPRVQYHRLASVEGGYEIERVRAWVSALSEHPFRDDTPSQWTTQETAPAWALSSTVDVRVAGTPEYPTRVDFSLLRQWGGNAAAQGQDAQGGGASQFEGRYPFQKAVAMGLRTQAIRRLAASSRVIYDFGHEGTIWSTELRYRPHDNWVLGVGADLLSAFSSPDTEDDADLIGRFRANDRVHAGVTYAF